MSKSKGNVVDPEEMVGKYGADTCRLFVLFANAPEKDMPWIESSVGGPRKFVERVFRFVTRNMDREASGDPAADRRALRKLHQTIRKVTEDFNNRWHFNTSIAALMELLNTVYDEEANLSCAALDQILPDMVLLIGPFAPYLAEALKESSLQSQWQVPTEIRSVAPLELPPGVSWKTLKLDGSELVEIEGSWVVCELLSSGVPSPQRCVLISNSRYITLNGPFATSCCSHTTATRPSLKYS